MKSLGDAPVRYYKLNETNGTVAFTLTTGGDTVNTNGIYDNAPILGVASIVPSETNNTAVQFVAGNSNQVAIPNNGDINVTRGPWLKRTIELWFNANSFPIGARPGRQVRRDQCPDAFRYGSLGRGRQSARHRCLPLESIRDNEYRGHQSRQRAPVCFTAYNSTDDGPGSPFGLLLNPPVYITYPVVTNVTYHVVGILDGDTTGTNGELRLYVDGSLVGRTTNGVGQIYDHNGAVHIAGGNGRSHLNVSGVWGYFNGVEQDVAIYDAVLSSDDILAHYQAGIGTSAFADNAADFCCESGSRRAIPTRCKCSLISRCRRKPRPT